MIFYRGRGLEKPSLTRIFLATPAYSGLTSAYTVSVFNAANALNEAGIGCELAIYSGNCHVDDGRNALVEEFFESACTDLVFLDADLHFRAEDLVKLAKYDKDVVAGIYPKKRDDEDYPVLLPQGELYSENGLIEVLGVPTGFLKISRKALGKLSACSPKYAKNKSREANTPLIFERTLEGNTRVGGDYAFCKKWRSLGGKIYVDPDMEFGHVGENTWSGSLKEWLLIKNGMADELIAELLVDLTRGKAVNFDKLVRVWDNAWSADAEFLSIIALLAEKANTPIIECGSGLSSLVLGASTKQPIYCIDQEFEHAKRVQGFVEYMGWNHVHVYHAPITEYDGFRWYEEVEDLSESSLIVCDGPRRQDGRYGLIPVIGDKIQDGARIIMHDYHTEKETMESWGFPFRKIGKDTGVVEVKK